MKPSKHRKSILNALSDKKLKIPSEIAQEVGTTTNNVSTYLNGLKEKKLVQCVNENDKKGRLYCITNVGEEILTYFSNYDYENK